MKGHLGDVGYQAAEDRDPSKRGTVEARPAAHCPEGREHPGGALQLWLGRGSAAGSLQGQDLGSRDWHSGPLCLQRSAHHRGGRDKAREGRSPWEGEGGKTPVLPATMGPKRDVGTAAALSTTESGTQLQCPLTDEWISQLV